MNRSRCNHTLLRRRLLRWYRRQRRDLPWRPTEKRPANAYHVLVSEAMLQQTQVATVMPYFHRFIHSLPTLADLAAANPQHVLRLWQGLGYYTRARNLHAAARVIVDQHGGIVPRKLAELQQLPGVGRYTAGAIASIAYDQPEPVLDGNVTRVLARLFAIGKPVDEPRTNRRLWSLAGELVPSRRAGDFNQAMMELGARLCTPARPDCGNCPLAGLCRAHASGRAPKLPIRSPRRPPKAITHRVLAIERRGRYLFQQRPEKGLWSSMWQLPTAETIGAQTPQQWSQRNLGLDLHRSAEVGQFIHQTTHRTICFIIHRATAKRGRIKAGQWRSLDDVEDLPLAKPQQRAIAMVRAAWGERGAGGGKRVA